MLYRVKQCLLKPVHKIGFIAGLGSTEMIRHSFNADMSKINWVIFNQNGWVRDFSIQLTSQKTELENPVHLNIGILNVIGKRILFYHIQHKKRIQHRQRSTYNENNRDTDIQSSSISRKPILYSIIFKEIKTKSG